MKKTIVSIILIICILCSSLVTAEDYTSLLLERNIISGDEKGLRENDKVLRCEFVKMVNRTFNLANSDKKVSFSDVSPSDWFYNDFVTAVQNGYVKGDENGKMNPYDNITRQEAVTMISRLTGTKNYSRTNFKDDVKIDNWAKSAVQTLADMGIISGNGDNTFNPQGYLTRYESFVILTRLIDIDTSKAIEISSPFDLYLFNIYPNNDFILTTSLDLGNLTLPLPLCSNGFYGNFDGQSFKISGISTEYNDYSLFKTLEGSIKNLTLVCPEIFASFTKINNGTIENCGHNSFSKGGKQLQSDKYTGAFAATNNSVIRSCYTSSYLAVRNDGYIGGICGINNGTISDCFTISDGDEHAYGIAVVNNSSIKNSFTAGSLTACMENSGLVSYVSFVSGESDIGTKVSIQSLNNIYNELPFTRDKNFAFPILASIPFSTSDNLYEFGGGSGTKDDPFIVSKASHIESIRSYPDSFFEQSADIDMSVLDNFTPIENFGGEYNGKGYIIKNLSIITPNTPKVALFETNTGKISNLHLEDAYIKSFENAASVVFENKGIISFVTADSYIEANNAGGIVFTCENTSFIEKTTFNGYIETKKSAAGVAHTNKGRIENCAFSGKIASTSGGGICFNSYNSISYCFSDGTVTASKTDAICVNNSKDITSCYHTTSSIHPECIFRETRQISFKESFPEFDFDNVWQIYNENTLIIKDSAKYLPSKVSNTTDFVGGCGTVSDPYKIVTPINFKNIEKFPDACYILMNDLDFAHTTDENGIMADGKNGLKPLENFSGVLDGNGYKITAIKQNSEIGGIFKTNSGTIRNLTVQSSSVSAESGGVICDTNNGIIYNTHINTNVSFGSGGALCRVNNGFISRCSFSSKASFEEDGGGICLINNKTISNCCVDGSIEGKNIASSIYGISKNENGIIENCFVTADLYFVKDFGTFYPVSDSYTNSKYLDRYNEKFDGNLSFDKITQKFTGFDFDNIWTFNSLNIPILSGCEYLNKALPTPFKSGTGTLENPYTISSAEDLYNIRMYPKSCFIVVNDINLLGEKKKSSLLNNGGKGFTPISNFHGKIDGNGHIISGLEILYSHTENSGLITNLTGTVENLKFVDCRIEGNENTGIVCGINHGNIRNISVVNSKVGSLNSNAGSVCGTNKGIIKDCINRSDIFSSGNTGGICGINENEIINCANYGGIVTDSQNNTVCGGGIAGKNAKVIKNSFNCGKVISYSDLISASSGGIAGENTGDIANCYNSGTISSKSTIVSYSGGICGKTDNDSYITNVYNNQYITAEAPSAFVGALIGSANGKIFNAYYDNTLSAPFGENYLLRDSSLALSPDRMADINCYENFNTSTIWTMSAGYGYPQLINNPHIIYPPTENIRDFAGGDGTLENPYRIFTPNQLDNVRKYLGSTYMLMGDLDMSQYCNLNGFEPIGDNIFGFFGTFVGNNHTISGISQQNDVYGGLFSKNNGEIYNLITENFNINAPLSGNIAAVNTGTIYNCVNLSDIFCIGDNVLTGGICGLNKSSGMIIYSSNSATVSAEGATSQAGGICYGNYGIIAGCFNSGDQVFSSGTKMSMAGGISSFNYGTISDCYSNADIYSTDISGGIVATNSSNIINCYTTATTVFGKTFGGICANAQNSIILNCYYPSDRIFTGVALGDDEGVTGVPAELMLEQSTFEGFDFENMWIMVDGYCPLILEAITE